jgi:ketosteroid isomerase-like protein
MRTNEAIVRDLYAAAEGNALDLDRFVAAFADDGYMLDVPSENRMQGRAMATSLAGFTAAFPDIHRELLAVYATGDTVIAELRIQGTHLGPLGELAPTGKKTDVPCCDVFRLKDGKVVAFHCYNMPTIMQKQLGS